LHLPRAIPEEWLLLVLLFAKQRVECSAKSGEILQLDGFYLSALPTNADLLD
jgi:hypothetical protein